MAAKDTSWINPDMRFDISGWVVDPERLDDAVSVEIRLGETMIARVPARGLRRQVKRLYGGDGRHGFRVIPPVEYLNGKTYALRVIRTDTGAALIDQPVAFVDLRLNLGDGRIGAGVVNAAGEGGVEGWVLDADDLDRALPVELWADGELAGRSIADRPVRNLLYRGQQRHGFAFRLPSRLFDDAEHTIEVRLPGGVVLASADARLRLPLAHRPAYESTAELGPDGTLGLTVSAVGPGELPIEVGLYSGERLLAVHRLASGVRAELPLADLLGGTPLRAGLLARVAPDDEPIGIAEPRALVRIVTARLVGNELQLEADVHPAIAGAGVVLGIDADGAPAQTVELRSAATGGRARATAMLATRPARIALHLADDPAPLAGYSLVSRGHASAAAPAAEGDRSWHGLDEPGVAQTVLARNNGGLVPDARPAGWAGTVAYDSPAHLLSGWVVDLSDPLEEVAVELLADGVVRARAVANEPAPVSLSGTRATLAAGFSFWLDTLTLPETAALTVRIADGAVFPVRPIPFAPAKRVEAQVDSLVWSEFRLTAAGSVHDLVRPGQPVAVELLLDDVVAARTLARGAIEGDTAFGFSVSVAVGPVDLERRLSVRAAGVPIPLPPLTVNDSAGEEEAAADAIDTPVAPGEAINGSFDTLDAQRASGWVMSTERPDAPVDLMLYVDGVPFAHGRTRIRRGDVQRRHGGNGFSGFSFELPQNAGIVDAMELRVEPLVAAGTLAKSSRSVPPRLANAEGARLRAPAVPVPTGGRGFAPAVSLIILNQNGEALLDALFESVLRFEPDPPFEWLVVDHVSTDDSEAACARARDAGLDVRWLPRDANHSFSDSNNWGVGHARGEVVVFINNDVELAGRAIGAACELLSDPAVGAVGLKLMDAIGHGIWAAAPPVQHLGVYVSPTLTERRFRPFEARLVPEVQATANGIADVPAVTGAFMAMRRADFEALGGFDPRYFYGWEDVDLCLRVTEVLGKRIVCLNERAALHHRGFTRSDGKHKDPRRETNADAFNRLWGRRLRMRIRQDLLSRPGHWLGHRPVIAFAVTEASGDTAAGDYFTALELGRALQRIMPVHVAYLGAGSWYDLSDVDVLIAMVDRFDPARIEAARPHLSLVAWARNWFDRWCERPGIHAFDQVWASSSKAAAWMTEQLGRPVDVVRIATNPGSFAAAEPDPALASDYCFTGSRFGVARDVELDLRPQQIDADGAVFGHNWAGSPLAAIDRGPVPYSGMPAVYASTKIVLDDANVATKAWGSCNSRVFDALAAGRLVLSNGEEGARELFGNLLPVWRNRRELERLLGEWLGDDRQRAERVAALREIVLAEHTYDVRAAQVRGLLGRQRQRLRFAIKIAATEAASAAWGDFHFAQSLADAIRAEGHLARVDLRERWYGGLADSDDVVIVLRGIVSYEPAPHQVNLAWVISHPEDLSGKEIGGYDHLFVASELFAVQLAALTDVPVTPLLQCTDPGRFNPDGVDQGAPATELLFVGNSRGVERESVRWALDEGLPLTLYGGGWKTLVPAGALAGRYVPNEILGSLYARARFVLCDHWHDMRRHGFVSNRVFDVLAAGGDIIVDEVPGLEALPDGVHVYRSREELGRIVREGSPRTPEAKRATAAWVAEHHSFAARARVFVAAALALSSEHVAVPATEAAQPDEPVETA